MKKQGIYNKFWVLIEGSVMETIPKHIQDDQHLIVALLFL
jgi:hypothetical protein